MNRKLLAALAATALFAGACSSDTEPGAAPTPATPSAAASDDTQSSSTVPAQLQFTAQTVDGQEFKGESVLGQPSVFWFWAPWCPTCQREAPMVGKISESRDDVTFVGVAGLDEVPAMQEFVDKYPVEGITNLADTEGTVWAKFGITQQPAWAFVSADGGVDVVRGELSEPELTERITTLVKQ